MHIGKRIKKIRELNNIERKNIAIISYSHLGNIESGQFKASEQVLIDLSEILNVPKDYLVRWQEYDIDLNLELTSLKNEIEENLDKAEQRIKEIKVNHSYIYSLYLEIYFFLLETYYLLKIGKYEHALSYYIKEVEPLIEIEKTPNNSMKEIYYYVQGTLHYYQKDFYKSLKYYELLIPLVTKSKIKAAINYNIALCLTKIKSFEKAVQYAENSLNIYLVERMFNRVADADNLLGAIYWRLKELDKAKDHLNKSLALSEQYQYKDILAKNYHNMGLVYQEEGNLEESLKFFQKSLDLKSESESKIITYRSILEIYLEQNRLEIAKETLLQARKLKISTFEYNHLKIIEANLYLKQGDDKKYTKNMNEGIDYFLDNNHSEQLDGILEEYGDYLMSVNKNKAAAKYFKLALETKNKLRR